MTALIVLYSSECPYCEDENNHSHLGIVICECCNRPYFTPFAFIGPNRSMSNGRYQAYAPPAYDLSMEDEERDIREITEFRRDWTAYHDAQKR